jgi:S1-C subfamily serine protease
MLVAAAAVTLFSPVRAQERPAPPPRMWVNGEEIRPMDLIGNRRARIGAVIDLRATQNDSIGATVRSVTPGGPAAKAGIRGGDIITKLNGKSLVRTGSADDRRGDESLAGIKLLELVAKLDPQDTVMVEYRRGGETKTVSLVAGNERMLALGDGVFNWNLSDDGDRGFRALTVPRMRIRSDHNGDFLFGFGGPFADLELAPLNPDLGAYFGTTEGVLVIDAPEKSLLGLKGGDVVLSIDGRRPSGPASLLRILGSYEPGDVIKLEIMRNKSRTTISTKIDKNDE